MCVSPQNYKGLSRRKSQARAEAIGHDIVVQTLNISTGMNIKINQKIKIQ